MSRNTVSPAFAGDDGRACGALYFATNSIFKEPTAIRCRAVIASEAKQSIRQQDGKSGLLRFARNDVAPIPDMRLRPRGAMRPSCTGISRPIEGVGNAGCPLHPQPRVRSVESTRVFTTVAPEHPAFPHAMVLTAYFVLSPVTGLFCHRRQRICGLSAPGWADLPSANLTPASGRQDHTILPSAATSLVRVLLIAHGFKRTRPAIPSRAKRCRVHRIPPRVRDDHDTPLCGVGWRKF